MSENLVQFTAEPADYICGYEISLTRKETGTVYEGSFVRSDNGSTGPVDCEVYKSLEGVEKFVLHGKWFEGRQYFWYAKFFSLNFPD